MEPIVFELRDIDGDVVRAWEKYFKGIASLTLGSSAKGGSHWFKSTAYSTTGD